MSRVAKSPVTIPSGVEVKLDASNISVKGKKGTLVMSLHKSVEIKQEDGSLVFSAREGAKEGWAMAGTTRSLTNNMVVGVSEGFQRKLILNGVGYRAKANGKSINLVLGFSHPIDYDLPEGVTVETPTQTEVVLSGTDKQVLGKVAAEIRAFRPPEPYKGKGVRYAEENVRRKEAKKK
ncbi:50S ribosomal protein L6 [Zhongshania aliphaticivorans]|uniref:Large ribosomal subunit protein uL6 n=1 Tax=Zhongshania aliphaticivorans TaxID=1470434 RepID=A0A5S9Q4M7_9GAMM|nr:50S ribosomal protein L6 [Zhongshania aliphaticivorans]CAA0111949.1 50S ribosomal protein L6 [Zhongshania aliphaticivorans]CAA0118929.1 50S ribosomal protein L6 [Zhongshania aliphaticivorans]